MHSYLNAIGFSKYKTKRELRDFLNEIIESPDEEIAFSSNTGEDVIEYKKEYGEGFGIIVHAYLDEETRNPQVEYYFPYIEGNFVQANEEVLIEKHIARDSYAGVCDDLRIGVSLIFYLQNAIDYVNARALERVNARLMPIVFSALSLNGTILFPINKTPKEIKKSKVAVKNRKSLLEAARKGDEDAMESLTMEDLDTYTKISKRIMNEDVFSIVDSSFMPYGIECDQYTIISSIIDVKLLQNEVSGEDVYNLAVNCNDMIFNVLINKKNLIGEPAPGRRFKGSLWLQGKVLFNDDNQN